MPPINRRNAARPDLLLPDQLGQGYQHWQEPIGDYGIFNGQFELGPGSGSPPGWPVGWEVSTWVGGSVTRVIGGFAGDWCMYGGQVGTGAGGQIVTLRYFPINDDEDYYVAATFKGSDVNAQAILGVATYDAAKVLVAVAPVLTVSPGTSWITYERHLGPSADSDNAIVVGANARYLRIFANLQNDNTLTNAWIWADNIQFQQLKATQSAKVYLEQDRIDVGVYDFTDHTAYVAYPGSTLTLTLTEPGYIWWRYYWDTSNETAVRANSARWQVYVDGAGEGGAINVCSPGISYKMPMAMSGRSANVLAVGAHTVDIRCQVINAGDTQRGNDLTGAAFYARGL